VTLGRIELLDDELVLTVNSAARLAAARKWLDKLPGVKFRAVTTRRWDEPAADRPADERVSRPQPVEITPELAKSLQVMMNKKYMQWLDMSLPALRGKTPRQACRTPAGRDNDPDDPRPDGTGPDFRPAPGNAAGIGAGIRERDGRERAGKPGKASPAGSNLPAGHLRELAFHPAQHHRGRPDP
jgi:hypothetical protein